MQDSTSIPFGRCHCGCGQKTNPAPKTVAAKGIKAGEPQRFIAGHHRRKRDNYIVEDRGYDTPCWVWQGAKRPSNGGLYGTMWYDNRLQPAHRYYYELAYGKVEQGMQLDHLCRVTLCCRADHLEPVTVEDNLRRGRSSKLGKDDLTTIRDALIAGTSRQEVAEHHGVSLATVHRLANRLQVPKSSPKEWQRPKKALDLPTPQQLHLDVAKEASEGLCACGCGERTRTRYVKGHNARKYRGPAYVEEDRGYTTPCWIWQYGRYPNGYPQVIVDRAPRLAHRHLYQQQYGPLPKHMHLHHQCEQPICVNPDHLEPLTPATHARVRKTTKLNSAKVARIRELYATGEYSYRTLGEQFGVGAMTVCHVIRGDTWT